MNDLLERLDKALENDVKDLNLRENIKNYLAGLITAKKNNKPTSKDFIVTGLKEERLKFVKLLAKILKDEGVLKSDEVRVYHKEDLISDFVGQTSQKMMDILTSLNDKVFYLDDADDLTDDIKTKLAGREIIDCLKDSIGNIELNTLIVLGGDNKELDNFFYNAPCIRVKIAHIFKL